MKNFNFIIRKVVLGATLWCLIPTAIAQQTVEIESNFNFRICQTDVRSYGINLNGFTTDLAGHINVTTYWSVQGGYKYFGGVNDTSGIIYNSSGPVLPAIRWNTPGVGKLKVRVVDNITPGEASASYTVNVLRNPTLPTISAYYSDGTLFNNGSGGDPDWGGDGYITTTFYKGLASETYVNLKIGNLVDTNYYTVQVLFGYRIPGEPPYYQANYTEAYLNPNDTSITTQVDPSILRYSTYSIDWGNVYYAYVQNNQGCISINSIAFFMEDVSCGNDNTKVLVCHNGKEICISHSALSTHQAHGDSVGYCVSGRVAANTTGIENLDANTGLSIFPNPVQDILSIRSTSSFTGRLALWDISGRHVIEADMQNGTCEMDVSTLPPGFYMLSMGGKTGTIKVIKD